MRKLLALSVFMVSAVVLMMTQMTYAIFTDTATSTGNTFSAEESPLTHPLTSPVTSVVLNEIMWPGSFNGDDEWIELRNTTSDPIDLTNWKIDAGGAGNAQLVITSGTIPSNGFFLISNFNENSPSSILNVTPDFVSSSVSLANSPAGEQLILRNSANIVIDTANTTPGWFAGSVTPPRKSMERNAIPGNGTINTNWHTATSQVNIDPGATESATPKSINSL